MTFGVEVCGFRASDSFLDCLGDGGREISESNGSIFYPSMLVFVIFNFLSKSFIKVYELSAIEATLL